MPIPWTYIRSHSRHSIVGDPLDLAFYAGTMDPSSRRFVETEQEAYVENVRGYWERYDYDLAASPWQRPRTFFPRRGGFQAPTSLSDAVTFVRKLQGLLELHKWRPSTDPQAFRHHGTLSTVQWKPVQPYYSYPWRTRDLLAGVDNKNNFRDGWLSLKEARSCILEWSSAKVNPLFKKSVNRAPIELYEMIVEYVIAGETKIERRQKLLATLCLVCKAWLPRSQYLLYSIIKLRYADQGLSLIKTLQDKPYLGSFTQDLTLIRYPASHLMSTLLALSSHLCNLRRLELSSIILSGVHSDFFSGILSFPTVQEFYIKHSGDAPTPHLFLETKRLCLMCPRMNSFILHTALDVSPSPKGVLKSPWHFKSFTLSEIDVIQSSVFSWFLTGLAQKSEVDHPLVKADIKGVVFDKAACILHMNRFLKRFGKSLQYLHIQLDEQPTDNLHILDFEYCTSLISTTWFSDHINNIFGLAASLPTIMTSNQSCKHSIAFQPLSEEDLKTTDLLFSDIADTMNKVVQVKIIWLHINTLDWRSTLPKLDRQKMLTVVNSK
ncbi:hypothetical protein K474DRAFT_359591 [Panus rudis PR-1116 ss-1]|nr:hypothetical protein K474DRAFT_359591 [Panus rudis PR-1116 ss-1]